MSSAQLLRPKFFEGQYLGAEDLTAAVDYARIQDARHLLGPHTWGIAIGLNLKEVTQPGGQLQVFIQPGYAWDGFGRPIVVLAPYALNAELFKAFLFDPALPNGRLVPVWLRYREVDTREPREGFQLCTTGDQTSRIQESFTAEAGDRPNVSDRHDNIIIAGNSVEASQAFKAFDPADPVIYDESIPHQTFPSAGRTKWLVPLGYVRWQPNVAAGQPGSFRPLDAADKAASAALRVTISAVAGAIQAAEGVLRLKNRIVAPSAVASTDLVWVEGNLRVEGDARLFGGKLDFLDTQGQDQGTPLTCLRVPDSVTGGHQLRAQIGAATDGLNSFQVGPVDSGTFAPVLTVRDDGNVRIDSAAPAGLEINGGDLLLKGSAEDAGDLIFQNSTGTQKGRVWSNPNPGAALFLASTGTTAMLAIDANGLVGIGTTAPDRAVTVQGAAGTYLNVKGDGGAEEVLLGADGNGGIVSTMTNHDLQLRAGVNSTKMTIKADGKIGVGTTAPARQFHVIGDRIRLQNGSKTLDMRADGSAVDLQSETNNLYLRASGPANNNNIVMNAVAGDGFVGIGVQAPVCKLHVQNSLAGSASLEQSHVAIIENTSPSNLADVLALKIAALQPGADNNYVTFFAGTNAVGAIEGNAVGTITYSSSGADFAESVPRLREEEVLDAGDVVGIINGKITLITEGAHHVSAITGRPIVLGNAPRPAERKSYGSVAMLGQVDVKVRGPVNAGDLIVPSGSYDGVGIAVTPEQAAERGITQIVGTAWESSPENGVKLISTAIGLASPLLRIQQVEIHRLRRQLKGGDGEA